MTGFLRRSLAATPSPRLLHFEGKSKVTFFDDNFSEYEDWRRQTLGDATTRAHRITYRRLTRYLPPAWPVT